MRRRGRPGSRPGGKFTTTLEFTDAAGAARAIEAEITVSPYDPGRYSGPMEDSYPAEGGCVENVTLTLMKADGTAERTLDEAEAATLLGIETEELAGRLQEAGDEGARAADDDGPDEPDEPPDYDDRYADGEFSEACDRYTR